MAMRAFIPFGLALLLTPLCLGHAVLIQASPMPNGLISGPDINVELRFNSRIDSTRSRLALVLPNQTVRLLALRRSATPASLTAHVTALEAGEYKLRWQVLASDGHIT